MRSPAPARASLLVVEDEEDVRLLLRNGLQRAGYAVSAAASAEEGISLFHSRRPDLALVDIMLPRADGLELLRLLRKQSDVPIILLTALCGEADRVAGLRLGADDYIAKPFAMEEVAARVAAILRRRRPPSDGLLRRGRIELDVHRRDVRVAGRARELSPHEFDLLESLLRADGKPLSRQELLERVWGIAKDIGITTRTVDQHVARLRRKLRGAKGQLRTVRGRGYALDGLAR